MAAITWDAEGSRYYETGIDRGVLYVYDKETKSYKNGVAWNGLSSVSESPEGAESNPIYADNIKYLDLISNEDFKGTIEAYTYPDEMAECDGTAKLLGGMTIGQQSRAKFGLCYRTKVGTDIDSEAGYKLHFVYGCSAAPTQKQYQTVSDSPEAITFSWEISTTPITIGTIDGVEYKPTAIVVIDTTKLDESSKANVKALEDYIYGTAEGQAKFPTPSQIYNILKTGEAA